jgi:hypothetical protein
MPKWSELTKEQKAYIKELRKSGWSLHEAIIQALCTA